VQLTTAQRALWKAYDRQTALTAEEAEAYTKLTGKPPWKAGSKAPHFVCMTLSRGGGKSLLLATIAVYEAITNPYEAAPGETVAIVALAPRLKQSKDLFRYSKAHLERPALAPFVESIVAEEIRLVNGRLLRTQACDKSGGAARGPTYITALFDESAFLNHDGLVIDEEQWRAILAGARGVSDFRGVLSSTPNGKAGFFWETFDEYFGRQGAPWDVFSGPQPLIRPEMDQGLLQEFQRADPEAFKREFLCDFTAGTGAATFFNAGQVESCIESGVIEVPSSGPVASYSCAVDPSGGSNDCFTVCIVERLEDGSIRQCLARAWDPKEQAFSVNAVAREIAELIAPFGIRTVYGDIFGGQWVAEAFAAVGLEYQVRGFNGQNKLQRAACLRELFSTGRIRLLDIAKQTKELTEYEEKRLQSGQVSVNHPNTKDGSDDYLDALALAVWELVGQLTEIHPPGSLINGSKLVREGFDGGRYPMTTPSSAGIPLRFYMPAKDIAAKGENARWLMGNWSRDWRYALCSVGELAWLCGISPYEWMNFLGRDLVLQHQWMRWVCGYYRDAQSIIRGRQIVAVGDFPNIPAFKEIKARTVNNEFHTRGIVSFGVATEPAQAKLGETYIRENGQTYIGSALGSWPCDLTFASSVYPNGDVPVSRCPACPPFASARHEWNVFVDDGTHRYFAWPRETYSGLMEEVFEEGAFERAKIARLNDSIRRHQPTIPTSELKKEEKPKTQKHETNIDPNPPSFRRAW
jgi:hypothetical protein